MALPGEHELVLLLADMRHPDAQRMKQLIESRLNWVEVGGQLIAHRIAGLAFFQLMRAELLPYVPAEIALTLSTVFRYQKMRGEAYRRLVQEIATALADSRLPHAFLKGSVLTFSTYPLGCRLSKDVDILVNGRDLTGCGKVLQGLGFEQGSYDPSVHKIRPASRAEIIYSRVNTGEVIPYMRIDGAPGLTVAEVDLNFSLDWLAQGAEERVASFLSHTDTVHAGGAAIQSLALEYFLAHLCVHLYKEAVVLQWVESQRDLCLYKFLDIYCLLTDTERRFNVQRFVQLAGETGITKECYYALFHTQLLFPGLQRDAAVRQLLQDLRPADCSYLDEVVDASSPGKVYRWTEDFLPRFFDPLRRERLVEV